MPIADNFAAIAADMKRTEAADRPPRALRADQVRIVVAGRWTAAKQTFHGSSRRAWGAAIPEGALSSNDVG